LIANTIEKLLHRLASEIGREFLIGDLQLSRAGEPEADDDLRNAHIAVVTYFSAMARTASTLEDIGKLPKFGRRYVWDSRVLRRSDHIRFVWMTFLHLTYVYHERVHTVAKRIEEASNYVALNHVVSIPNELKLMKKAFGKYVRERGEATHEWGAERQEASVLEMVEMLAADGDPKWDVIGHYKEARDNMLAVVEQVHQRMALHFEDLVARHDPALQQMVSQFLELKQLALDDGIDVEAVGPNKSTFFGGRSFFRDRYQKA